MSDKIVLRVQSAEGTKRIETSLREKTSDLFEKVYETFGLSSFNFALFKERNKTEEIVSSRSNNLKHYGLRHGDMLYLHPLNGTTLLPVSDSHSSSTTSVSNSVSFVSEHEVDVYLQKQDGKIPREQDERLCRHNQKTRCVHCAPLEPYDDEFLREHNIKHMSFHTYLRKIKSGVDKGKFAALENTSCKIKAGCQDHLPWPKGICSKCQPSAVTLNRQIYRHVDNVMFENPQIVDRFLNYWRTTSHQRIGYLYGRYEYYKDVPLGIRATVAAIYEPPQESTRDMVRILADGQEAVVDDIAKQLGLTCIGWIFTDLITDDVTKGTVKYFRNSTSHFLSAQECIMAGDFQNHHPNPCKLSPEGYFGSKFVTVCVTGDVDNKVHMEGYQVSNQCMALVQDNCLVPTKDAPELAYVRESTNEQYVPDVFYKEKDEYGNEVVQLARPLPVEYLLLDVPIGAPVLPQSTFYVKDKVQPFPVANRMIDGHLQDFNALAKYLRQFSREEFLNAASDFHFLAFIASMETLPLREYMGPVLDAVKNKDAGLAQEWADSEQWATVEQLMAAQSPSPSTSQDGGSAMWTCRHCTFINQPERGLCDMCGLPR